MNAQKLRGREKRNIIKIIALTIMFFSTSVTATTVGIVTVDMFPQEPLETDIITFDIFGQASSKPSQVTYDEFTQNGTSLQLDLYIEMGMLPAVSDWTYSKDISPLSAESYTLEVRAFDNYSGILQDTYNLDFTVVPEPATILILGFGAVLVKRGDQL